MGFLGSCVMWPIEYPKAIIYAGIDGSAAHTVEDRWCNATHQIVGDRMEAPGVVAIGGARGGVAVVVEVDVRRCASQVAQRNGGSGAHRGARMVRVSSFAY